MAIYNIPEYRINDLEKKLAAISKKCNKYGKTFVYKKLDSFFDTISINSKKITIKFIPIEVKGTAKIDNWEFVATLERGTIGNVIKRYNTDIDIPSRFRVSENFCEHCNTNRYRKTLYIVHNTETNEFKQVGKNCLYSYTNGLSAEYVALYCSAINLLDEPEQVSCDIYDSKSFIHYYSVEEILCVSLEVVKQLGYRKADRENCTKDIVKSYESNGKDHTEKMYNLILDDATVFSENNYKTVKNIIDHYLKMDADTEFIHNIKVILSEKYCENSNIGLLAYLPYGYQKDIERKEKQEFEYNNNHFGIIGKRYKGIKVSLSLLASYNTDYGTTFVYKLLDDEKHILIWKTNKFFDIGCYNLSGTVKSQDEYKGQKQTNVTRCKMEKIN